MFKVSKRMAESNGKKCEEGGVLNKSLLHHIMALQARSYVTATKSGKSFEQQHQHTHSCRAKVETRRDT